MKGVLRARACCPGRGEAGGGPQRCGPPSYIQRYRCGTRMVPRRLAAVIARIVHRSSESSENIDKTLENG